jgi:hypothetical protein
MKSYKHLKLYLHIQASPFGHTAHISIYLTSPLHKLRRNQAEMLGSTHGRRDKNLAKRSKPVFEVDFSGAADRMVGILATYRLLTRAGERRKASGKPEKAVTEITIVTAIQGQSSSTVQHAVVKCPILNKQICKFLSSGYLCFPQSVQCI